MRSWIDELTDIINKQVNQNHFIWIEPEMKQKHNGLTTDFFFFADEQSKAIKIDCTGTLDV